MSKPKDKKVIIFDFDGVLVDSFDAFYPLIRDGMKKIGLPFTPDQYRNLFIGNVHRGFKDFINNKNKYEIFKEFRTANYDKYYYDKKLGAKLFPGALKFIKKISEKYILSVASSGKRDNIKNLLKEKGAEDLFGLILANFNYSKDTVIGEILDKFHVKPKETFMITDTVGDIEVAKKLGLKTIAVTWGFHSEELLRSAKPDHIANNFKMLYKILRAF